MGLLSPDIYLNKKITCHFLAMRWLRSMLRMTIMMFGLSRYPSYRCVLIRVIHRIYCIPT